MPPTSPFGRVTLAALDLSGAYSHVLSHAARVAANHGTRLHLLAVVEPPSGALARRLDKKELVALTKKMALDTADRLAEAAKAIKEKNLTVTTQVRAGNPAHEILAEQVEIGAGLIVAGARAEEGSPFLRLRTTPDRVVRAATVPVLVVGPGSPHLLKRILVPIEFDRMSQGAAQTALKLAAAHGGRVSLLHVIAEPSPLRLYSGDISKLLREIRADAKAHLEKFAAGLEIPAGAKPPHRLLEGTSETVQAAEAIIGEAARLKMDLIVIARGRHSTLHRVFIGSTAERVIRQLPCSLLALPSEWAKRR